MPRNTLIALAALLLMSASPAMAKAPACGKRVQAFNEYEELVKGKIVEKVSIFNVTEWSPDSAFEGLLVKADEDPNTKVEIESTQSGKAKTKKKKEWPAKAWKERKDFRLVEDFNSGKEVFGEKYEAGTFVVRLTLNGKVLCEDSALAISPSGD